MFCMSLVQLLHVQLEKGLFTYLSVFLLIEFKLLNDELVLITIDRFSRRLFLFK